MSGSPPCPLHLPFSSPFPPSLEAGVRGCYPRKLFGFVLCCMWVLAYFRTKKTDSVWCVSSCNNTNCFKFKRYTISAAILVLDINITIWSGMCRVCIRLRKCGPCVHNTNGSAQRYEVHNYGPYAELQIVLRIYRTNWIYTRGHLSLVWRSVYLHVDPWDLIFNSAVYELMVHIFALYAHGPNGPIQPQAKHADLDVPSGGWPPSFSPTVRHWSGMVKKNVTLV